MIPLSRYSDRKELSMLHYSISSTGCQLQLYATGKTNENCAILFLHGGPGSGAKAIMELPAFQAFTSHYLCIHFDQRGCGASYYDLHQGLVMEDLIADVKMIAEDIISRFSIKHLFLWGGSFGGYLASLCLQRIPELFQGVILSSPAITFNRLQALDFFHRMKKPYSKRLNTSLDIGNDPSPEAFFANPKVQAFIYSSHNPSMSLKHICAMGAWFFQTTFHGLFEESTVPVLVLQGMEDPICISQNITQEIAQCTNKRLTYHLLDHCGHAVFEDKEQVFVQTIHSFIGGIISC